MFQKILIASLLGFISSASISQTIFNLLEENNEKKILDWIDKNPKAKVNIFNEQLKFFYDQRYPVEKLSCVAEEINVLDVVILYDSHVAISSLLKKKEITENKEVLSQALNFAVHRNNSAVFKQLLALGAELNRPCDYFFGKNTLQIALSRKESSPLLDAIAEKSSEADFNHKDCIGRTVLHDLVENNHIAFFNVHKNRFNPSLLSGNENLEYPIEIAIKHGYVDLTKMLWTAMKNNSLTPESFTADNYRRLKYHAQLSKNATLNQWVDSVIVKSNKIDKNDLFQFMLSAKQYDLMKYMDDALYLSDIFLDLSSTRSNVPEKNFLEYLKSYQNFKLKSLGVQPVSQPTFHGRSGLIPIADMKYISKFFTDNYWNKKWMKIFSEAQMEDLTNRQLPLYYFSDTNIPGKFQSAFSIGFEFIIGFEGDLFEQAAYLFSTLNVHELSVKNVTDHPVNFKLYFPRLQYLEIDWVEPNLKDFQVNPELLTIKELKINGIESITFPRGSVSSGLEKIHVSSTTVVQNLPRGVKVVYF